MRALSYTICLAVALCLSSTGCAPKNPNLTPAGERAAAAKQALDGVAALSQTAINLNATKGKEHLSDRATAYVRDFALSSTVALQSYAEGHETLAGVIVSLNDLVRRLGAEPNLPDGFKRALQVVQAAIAALQGS